MEVLYPHCARFKNVPGRKTDVNDAMRIADLLAHGLIRSSFVQSAPIQKVLEDAAIKLGSVLSDILTVSGGACLTRSSLAKPIPSDWQTLPNGRPGASARISSKPCMAGSPPITAACSTKREMADNFTRLERRLLCHH